MEIVGSSEVKKHFSTVLKRMLKGEKITITKHGFPVAMLVPIENESRLSRNAAIDAMLAFGKGRGHIDPSEIKEMVEEGRINA